MRHYSNILQLVTHTTLERPVRHSQRDSLVNMAWPCTQYEVPMVCVQSQGFHGVVWCRSTLFPVLPSWGFLPGTWVEVPYLGVWKGPRLMCAWVTGWCVWSSICPSDLMGLMFGKSIAPHRTTAGSWCRQDMLWPLQHTRDSVYRTECTDFFFSCTMWEIDSQLEWLFFFFLSLAKCWLYCDLWLTCEASGEIRSF